MKDKYAEINELTALGFIINAMEGGGDKGQSFPRSDAEDLSRGLRFIPGEVTVARREGKQVAFVQICQNPCCWYWQFPDGPRTYYWERQNHEQINADRCPRCGNTHLTGGHISDSEI